MEIWLASARKIGGYWQLRFLERRRQGGPLILNVRPTSEGKGESSGMPEAPHSPEGLDADLVRHKTIEDNYAWVKKLLLLEALSATQMVQEKFKLLKGSYGEMQS
ncbi:hypothetical protein GH714_013562 [Hevea brasiliensis]|uniref:Uncharacterized protein n=1 Tax=Hevea brasiliensis TaxID=3981 RepID=A0A6A6KRA4_HEVBR|nr:hypothetical protein GH714_013562 [Hevea brasiliensis]